MNRFNIFFLIFIGLLFQKCDSKKDINPNIFFCDAEETSFFEDKFVSHGNEFEGAKGSTDDEAYEGERSCFVDNGNQNGMICTIIDPKPGEIFNVSVYRKSSDNVGRLIATSFDGSFKKVESISYGKKNENGWELISFNFQLPQDVSEIKSLKIFVNNKEEIKAYFDNLKIERVLIDKNNLLTEDSVDRINIQLLDVDYATLTKFRDKALIQEIITNDLKQEFEGLLRYKGETYHIGIRLKGDWTDHLIGRKWSYRIKIKGNVAFMGLKSFSIQAPEVRSFLNEWVVHEICKKEDLLTTKFEFLRVAINGVDFGIYNLEEHFEKQLLESKKRREGPILKFSENGFWERNLHMKAFGKDPNKPIFPAATILPFKKKKTFRRDKLRNNFLIAQNLMLNYKNGNPNTSNYIDIKKLAKAYAIMDICNVNHATTWHNQRFYYNPITSKLELIVYDCFAGPGDQYSRPVKILGDDTSGTHKITDPKEYLIKNNFDNTVFLKHYVTYLKKFSEPKYIDNLITSLSSQIDSLTLILRNDYIEYSYDKDLLKSNAKKIRQLLPKYEEKLKTAPPKYNLKEKILNECATEHPFKYFSLNAHIEKYDSIGPTKLSLRNFHCKPLKVLGYSSKIYPDSVILLSEPLILENFPDYKDNYNLTVYNKPKNIYFQVEDSKIDSVYSSKIIKWPRPKTDIPYRHLMKINLSSNSNIYHLKGDSIIFKKGKHRVNQNIIIPLNMHVVFEPGVELILNNNTFFMSYSAVQMGGSKRFPIKITSTDKTANGFTVIQANEKSVLNYVIFDGLNTFNNYGWTLTGAVTFFESDVDLSNCVFKNNNCEDALNIVKSLFLLDNCTIANAFLDGFDGDFCNGLVSNSIFNNTGNDCLDFSGSEIHVSNCEIKNAGDKGISCGEKSTIRIDNISIDRAVIGIASKDESKVLVSDLKLMNCQTGFSVFQKKPEYGVASIFVKSYQIENTKVPYYCQDGSHINFDYK
jgi:hypothetical protein